MKTHFVSLLAILSFAFPSLLVAADVTYVASMTGIECNECKKTIARTLGGLPGVKTIRISKTGEKSHRLTVVTDGSKDISKERAVRALKGKKLHYMIVSWSKSN